MHSLYDQACASMTLDHVNHVEREGVLPIAFSLVHQVLIEDGGLVFAGGPLPQFNAEWSEKMGLAIPEHGKAKTVQEMTLQRIGNYDEFLVFQRLVFGSPRSSSPRSIPGRSRKSSCPILTVLASSTRSRRAWAPSEASLAATRSNAGYISTDFATWERSNTPAPSWAWAE